MSTQSIINQWIHRCLPETDRPTRAKDRHMLDSEHSLDYSCHAHAADPALRHLLYLVSW